MTIGDVEFTGDEFLSLVTHDRMNDHPLAELALADDTEKVRRVSMADRVTVSADGRPIFSGHILKASHDGRNLRIECKTAPQFESELVGFASRTSPNQIMRMLVLDAGLTLPEADDENLVCKSSSRSLDWDEFFDEIEAAPHCEAAVAVVKRVTSTVSLSHAEEELMRKGLGRVHAAVDASGLADVPVSQIRPSSYCKAIVSWRADAWRYRMRHDDHEVIVPIQDLEVPLSTATVGGVTFMDASRTSALRPFLREIDDPFVRRGWDLPAYARTVVAAGDLWQARADGRQRVLTALAGMTFRTNYSATSWKLCEDEYAPLRYARPTGACPRMIDNTLVHNLVTDEYWMGPVGVPKATNLVLERSRGGSLLEAIDTLLNASDESDFSRHIGSALHWSYRADSSETAVDRFLMRWIALEMLLCGPDDETTDLIRRLPFTIISVGGKRTSIRRELERRWVPLRNDIVHRAVREHVSLAEGVVRVKYFADRSIAYALAMRHDFPSLQGWLTHLDELARKRPCQSNQSASARSDERDESS